MILIQLWRKYRIYIIIIVFITWIGFLDKNNLLALYKFKKELSGLKDKQDYYVLEIERMQAEKKLIFTDIKSLETFAREKYYMKKENEDIYVLKEK